MNKFHLHDYSLIQIIQSNRNQKYNIPSNWILKKLLSHLTLIEISIYIDTKWQIEKMLILTEGFFIHYYELDSRMPHWMLSISIELHLMTWTINMVTYMVWTMSNSLYHIDQAIAVVLRESVPTI